MWTNEELQEIRDRAELEASVDGKMLYGNQLACHWPQVLSIYAHLPKEFVMGK